MNRMTRFVGGVCACVICTWASAQTLTWSGAGESDLWSAANNWGGIAPVGGESLIFAGTTRCTNVNDLASGTAVAGITFSTDAGAFSLSGASIALNGTVVNSSARMPLINLDMALSATRTVNTLSNNVTLAGSISGSGGLIKTGGNTLYLSGSNTYEGVTTVNSGAIRVSHPNALGSTLGGTIVTADPYRLELSGNITVSNEAVTIIGKGNNNGVLQTVSGSNTWAGPVILGATDARIGVTPSNGVLVVAGVISDGTNAYSLVVRNADNGGPTILTSTNAYKGETKIIVGTLRLAGGDDRLPTNTVVRLGNSSNIATALLDLCGYNQTVAGMAQDGTTMPRKIINSVTSTVSTLTVNTRSAYTYSGSLSGNLNLEKVGTNRLTLAAFNDCFGQVSVREGILQLGTATALNDATLNTGTNAMGILSFDTNTVINVGGLVGSNDLVMTNTLGAPIHLRIRGTQTTSFDGRILSGSDLTKTGFGTFTLKHPATYTGRTYLVDGRLIIPYEDVLGVYPATFVQDQIIFDGGTLSFSSNFVLGASNRGITLNAGGAKFEQTDTNSTLTISKNLIGSGGLWKLGSGMVTLPVSNAYDGVTTVSRGILRVANPFALGSTVGGTVVESGYQLELADGVNVVNETLTIYSGGMTMTPVPPASPQVNRGAFQAGVNATAEWAGPLILGNNSTRVGAQNGGHLILSGVISGSNVANPLQISGNPGDRVKGVELRGQNTFAGKTELVRGVLVMGAENTLPSTTIVNVHWSSANSNELALLDLNGFSQIVAGLQNTGYSGSYAVITNRSATLATLTVNQAIDTDYNGLLLGNIALAKGGAGTLILTNQNAYSGATVVSGGTLRLAVNNALPVTNGVVLAGGTLDLAGSAQTIGSLNVTGASIVRLNGGSLAVTAQTADAWTGTVVVEGTLGATTLRIQPALTAEQLSHIQYEGGSVVQNAQGYIHKYYGTTLLIQ